MPRATDINFLWSRWKNKWLLYPAPQHLLQGFCKWCDRLAQQRKIYVKLSSIEKIWFHIHSFIHWLIPSRTLDVDSVELVVGGMEETVSDKVLHLSGVSKSSTERQLHIFNVFHCPPWRQPLSKMLGSTFLEYCAGTCCPTRLVSLWGCCRWRSVICAPVWSEAIYSSSRRSSSVVLTRFWITLRRCEKLLSESKLYLPAWKEERVR